MEVKSFGKNYSISTKHSIAVCSFIRGKTIAEAITLLEKVREKKIAVPMKGEIPHKSGKGMVGGRYPVKACFHFIKLLKNLRGNASLKNLEAETTIIKIAKADKGPTGMRTGRKGRVGKSTHILLIGEGKEVVKDKRMKKAEKKQEAVEKKEKPEESKEKPAIPERKEQELEAKEIKHEVKEPVGILRRKERYFKGDEGGKK